MSEEPTFHHCHSCPADWTKGQWTPECPECGGGPLEIDCVFCRGRCGARWHREVMESHDHARAQWTGTCLLSEEDKEEIRSLGIERYEKERKRRMRRGKPSMAVAGLGFMGALVLVGLVMARNMESVNRCLGRHSDEVLQEVAQDQGNEAIDVGQDHRPGAPAPSKADHSREIAAEGGKEAAKGLPDAQDPSSPGKAPSDTTRLENRDMDAFLLENIGSD